MPVRFRLSGRCCAAARGSLGQWQLFVPLECALLPDPSALLLSASGLGYRYGSFAALRDVSLELSPGEIVALVGRNGAGKSTLLRCLAGWYQIEEGEVSPGLLTGEDRASVARTVLVPDTPSFYGELTAWEHLQFISQLHGRTAWQPEAKRLLGALGLGGHEKAYASSFSRGMQYKLALAVALLSRPDVLLLDEPFGPLDALSSEALYGELRRFAAEGRGVLVSAHQMPEAVAPERFLLLEDGRILTQGTAADLKQRYGLQSISGEDLLRAALHQGHAEP